MEKNGRVVEYRVRINLWFTIVLLVQGVKNNNKAHYYKGRYKVIIDGEKSQTNLRHVERSRGKQQQQQH